MNIKQIHAHFLISTGNYCNERIGFTVELDEGEAPETVVQTLREKAIALVGQSAQDHYHEIYRTEQELREVKTKLAKYRDEWNSMAEFLKAQGIKPDAQPMPKFSNLLKPVEHEAVIDGEIEDDIPL